MTHVTIDFARIDGATTQVNAFVYVAPPPVVVVPPPRHRHGYWHGRNDEYRRWR